MTSPALPALEPIIEAVEAAGTLAQKLGPRSPTRKSDGSWVTEADLAVAAMLRDALTTICSEAAHLDEEAGGRLGPDLTWVVDPIDGTTNFKRGDDRWCVSVGLMFQGTPLLGVVHQPTLGRTWSADPSGPRFSIDGPGDVGMMLGGRVPFSVPRWIRMLQQTRGAHSLRMTGSAALDFVDVAIGRSERVMALGVSLWDYAAGWALVRSVGGEVHRWPTGRRWDVLASHR
jgi:myo-inositol-1(or 4)-monophosphatase